MELVSIHKHTFILLLFLFGFASVQGQTWTMQQCIDTAQVYNKNLQMSRNYMAIGEQKMKEAKANLLPKVTANVDYKYFTNLPYQLLPLSTFNASAPEGQFKEAQFGVPHNINAAVQLSLPIYNPQISGAIKSTEIATEIAQLQLHKSEEDLIYNVSFLYYNAKVLYYQLGFVDTNLINAKKLLKHMELMRNQLMVKGTDVSKVKLQVDQLTTQKSNIVIKIDQVLNSLKFAMGLPLDRKLALDKTVIMEEEVLYNFNATIDMQISSTQRKLISNEISTLKNSKVLPTIQLIASFGTTGLGYSGQPERFLNFYPIGFGALQINYPIYDGKAMSRKINQKQLELQNNTIQHALIQSQSELQVQNALLQRNVAKNNLTTNQAHIALANDIYDQTLLQQKEGVASISDILLADNTLREAQQNFVTSMIEYLKAELEILKLSGNIALSK